MGPDYYRENPFVCAPSTWSSGDSNVQRGSHFFVAHMGISLKEERHHIINIVRTSTVGSKANVAWLVYSGGDCLCFSKCEYVPLTMNMSLFHPTHKGGHYTTIAVSTSTEASKVGCIYFPSWEWICFCSIKRNSFWGEKDGKILLKGQNRYITIAVNTSTGEVKSNGIWLYSWEIINFACSPQIRLSGESNSVDVSFSSLP